VYTRTNAASHELRVLGLQDENSGITVYPNENPRFKIFNVISPIVSMKMLAILMIMQIASGSALVELESRSICSIAMLASNSSPGMMMRCDAIQYPAHLAIVN